MNVAAHPDAGLASPALFTTAEFARIFSEALKLDIHLELIDGRLERVSPPMGGHFSRQTATVAALWSAVRDRTMVEAMIDFGMDTVMTADVAVLHAPKAEQRFLRFNEVMLAIEIAETTSVRDTTVKRFAYACAGIGIYWVVDGQRRVTQVYSMPDAGDYASIATVRFGEPLAVPGTDAVIVID